MTSREQAIERAGEALRTAWERPDRCSQEPAKRASAESSAEWAVRNMLDALALPPTLVTSTEREPLPLSGPFSIATEVLAAFGYKFDREAPSHRDKAMLAYDRLRPLGIAPEHEQAIRERRDSASRAGAVADRAALISALDAARHALSRVGPPPETRERAATIEECAMVCETRWITPASRMAARIRALAPTPVRVEAEPQDDEPSSEEALAHVRALSPELVAAMLADDDAAPEQPTLPMSSVVAGIVEELYDNAEREAADDNGGKGQYAASVLEGAAASIARDWPTREAAALRTVVEAAIERGYQLGAADFGRAEAEATHMFPEARKREADAILRDATRGGGRHV